MTFNMTALEANLAGEESKRFVPLTVRRVCRWFLHNATGVISAASYGAKCDGTNWYVN